MAISTQYWFDYEAILESEADGSFVGVATNLQTLRGSMPGLAGAHPTVRVRGDTLRLESSPADRPVTGSRGSLLSMAIFALPAIDALFGVRFIYRLRNRLIEAKEGRALGRAFAIEVRGLGEHLRPGRTLRAKMEVLAGPGREIETTTEVSVRDGTGEIWRSSPGSLGPIVPEPWPN